MQLRKLRADFKEQSEAMLLRVGVKQGKCLVKADRLKPMGGHVNGGPKRTPVHSTKQQVRSTYTAASSHSGTGLVPDMA